MSIIKVKSIKKITYIQLLLLHIGIAFLIYLFPFLSKIIFPAIIGFFMLLIVAKQNKNHEALIAAAYITGAEVFFRMTKGALFYETGKYAVILFLLMGLFFRGTSKKTIPYWIYIFLLVPGVLFSAINLSYEVDVRNAIAFNLSGPVTVGIVGVYCFYRNVTIEKLHQVLLAVLLPIITLAFYLFFYTPNIRDSLVGTASNYAASGGFGPNQVATIIGLGIIILFMRIFSIKDRMINSIDVLLLLLLTYRGLVTFSRGGMVTAAVCVVGFLVLYFYFADTVTKAKFMPKVFFILMFLIFTWLFTSFQTSGLIDKRYSNQDAAGRLKQDITTGRAEIMTSEMQAFFEYPITGVGIGKVKEYRQQHYGVNIATHNEISRILSEHGLFGLCALLIIALSPLLYWLKYQRNVYFFSFYLFWLLTIAHSSMRIAAPAFIYGLCLLLILNEKDTIYRKPATN